MEGTSLEDLFRGRSVNLAEVAARLKSVARQEGLPYTDRKMTYNSRLAQELGKWAESQGKGEEFHHLAFRAYFVDGKNIAEIPVLMEIAAAAGLPGEQVKSIACDRSFKEAVDADWSRSRRMGVTAVPTFIMQDERLVGAQPYAVLERFLIRMGMKERK
jgi:predicted DsbA family dithiol-disulfide isomerase